MLLKELKEGQRFEFVDKSTYLISAVTGDSYHPNRIFRFVRHSENACPVLLCEDVQNEITVMPGTNYRHVLLLLV